LNQSTSIHPFTVPFLERFFSNPNRIQTILPAMASTTNGAPFFEPRTRKKYIYRCLKRSQPLAARISWTSAVHRLKKLPSGLLTMISRRAYLD
jgi:hypothetical protein